MLKCYNKKITKCYKVALPPLNKGKIANSYKCSFNLIECDKGMYGNGCNGTCGHCLEVNQCSNVNGTCLSGCSAGYQGELCNEGGLTDLMYAKTLNEQLNLVCGCSFDTCVNLFHVLFYVKQMFI